MVWAPTKDNDNDGGNDSGGVSSEDEGDNTGIENVIKHDINYWGVAGTIVGLESLIYSGFAGYAFYVLSKIKSAQTEERIAATSSKIAKEGQEAFKSVYEAGKRNVLSKKSCEFIDAGIASSSFDNFGYTTLKVHYRINSLEAARAIEIVKGNVERSTKLLSEIDYYRRKFSFYRYYVDDALRAVYTPPEVTLASVRVGNPILSLGGRTVTSQFNVATTIKHAKLLRPIAKSADDAGAASTKAVSKINAATVEYNRLNGVYVSATRDLSAKKAALEVLKASNGAEALEVASKPFLERLSFSFKRAPWLNMLSKVSTVFLAALDVVYTVGTVAELMGWTKEDGNPAAWVNYGMDWVFSKIASWF